MSLLNNLVNTGMDAFNKAKEELGKFMDKPTAKGTIAALALVTMADGKKDDEEVVATSEFITEDETLSKQDPEALITEYETYVNKIEKNKIIGRATCLQQIAKVKSTNARTVVIYSIEVAKSKGKIDDSEKKVIIEICHTVSIDPSQFPELN